MDLRLECESEVEGRWRAEVHQLPRRLDYADTETEATARAEFLALRGVAERAAHGVARPQPVRWLVPAG